eukprot:COSAG01_NODE_1708_length_9425_cov_5.499893_4_plen_138_part_00
MPPPPCMSAAELSAPLPAAAGCPNWPRRSTTPPRSTAAMTPLPLSAPLAVLGAGSVMFAHFGPSDDTDSGSDIVPLSCVMTGGSDATATRATTAAMPSWLHSALLASAGKETYPGVCIPLVNAQIATSHYRAISATK